MAIARALVDIVEMSFIVHVCFRYLLIVILFSLTKYLTTFEQRRLILGMNMLSFAETFMFFDFSKFK